MKVLTWNLEWADVNRPRGKILSERIRNEDPNVVCFTEVLTDFVPAGYNIEADADYGYPHLGNRLKVILWSKTPWTDVDIIGDPQIPTGRFVSGISNAVRFVGVCIPWKDAHVKHGTKNKQPWEDHIAYCRGLKTVLEKFAKQSEPVCILGDFNQRFPRKWQPEQVYNALLEALPEGYRIVTEGVQDEDGKQLIDHVVASPGLKVSVGRTISRFAADGTELSDHTGIYFALEANC